MRCESRNLIPVVKAMLRTTDITGRQEKEKSASADNL